MSTRSPGSAVRWGLLVALVVSSNGCGDAERPPEAPEVIAEGPATPAPGAPRLLPVRRVRGEEEETFGLAERMAHHGVRAVGVAVVENGEVAETWSRRLDAPGTLVDLDEATLFPGGALGSPVASALIGFGVVQWAANEHVDLDTALLDRIDGLRLVADPSSGAGSRPSPTVAQVLAHSAGLPETETPPGVPPERRLAALAPRGQLRLIDVPGRRHVFASSGALLMRELLLRQAGSDSLQTGMSDLVLGPWGLDSTWLEGLPERAASRAVGREPPAPDGAQHLAGDAGLRSDLWTTPADLARWVTGLIASARGVSTDAPLPWTIARRALEPGPGGWAWGVQIVAPGPRFEVVTARAGLSVLVMGDVGSQLGFVVMTVGGEATDWLAREIERGVAATRGWPGFEAEVLDRAPAESVAKALVGRYRFGEGDVTVRLEDGRLLASAPAGVLGARPVDQAIYPLAPLRYVFLDRPERLEFVRTRGVGVRGLLIGERSGLRVDGSTAP